ncbi:hypothetical protein LZ30DRAFT_606732 [Colletotrichum cereale]|nr:hypothetical protein LZ30DRAFT_606732 [Colletotrichum cereale]
MTTSPMELVSLIPQCSIPCLTNLFLNSGCALDAIAPCFCTNITLLHDVSECVQTSCGYQDQLKLSSVTGGLCDPYPHPSRIPEIKMVVALLAVVTFPIVGLRLISRWIVASRLALDDWMTLVTAVATNLGFGLHYWNINPTNAERIIKLFWSVQMLYVTVLILAKLTIVALFGRLFPDPRFQFFNKMVIAFLICHGVVFLLIIMFQCTPIAGVWNHFVAGTCLDIQAVALASAILSIVEDFVILGIPIHQLRNLQLGLKKKIAVCFMLSLGSFACITSILRLRWLVVLAQSHDITWTNVDVVAWTIAEVSCALMCGSLPSLRPVFMKIPGILTTLRGSRATVQMQGLDGKGSGHSSVGKEGIRPRPQSPKSGPLLSDSEESFSIIVPVAKPADVRMKPLPSPPSELSGYQRPHRDSGRSSMSTRTPRIPMTPRTPMTLKTPLSVRSPKREADEEYELESRGAVEVKRWM